MVTGLGTYLYTVPSKNGLVNTYLLFGFIVEVSKDISGNKIVKIDASPICSVHKKYRHSCISLN
jgi:hypothetical protein